ITDFHQAHSATGYDRQRGVPAIVRHEHATPHRGLNQIQPLVADIDPFVVDVNDRHEACLQPCNAKPLPNSSRPEGTQTMYREAVRHLSPGSRVFERTLGLRGTDTNFKPERVAQPVTCRTLTGFSLGLRQLPRVRSKTRDPGLRCLTPN